MQVKIMRGISGAGKSTYARKIAFEAHTQGLLPMICSADDFFVGPDGYKFNPSNLGQAHKYCMSRFLRCLMDNMSPVIVDNTNLNIEDISPYVAVGEALGYEVEIIQINTDPELAGRRNLHGVPQNKVYEMYRRLTSGAISRRWKVTQVNL